MTRKKILLIIESILIIICIGLLVFYFLSRSNSESLRKDNLNSSIISNSNINSTSILYSSKSDKKYYLIIQGNPTNINNPCIINVKLDTFNLPIKSVVTDATYTTNQNTVGVQDISGSFPSTTNNLVINFQPSSTNQIRIILEATI